MSQRQFIAKRSFRPNLGKESIFHNYYDDPIGTIINETKNDYEYFLIMCSSGVEVFESYQSDKYEPTSKQIYIFCEEENTGKSNFFGTACRVKMGKDRKLMMQNLYENKASISVNDNLQLAENLSSWAIAIANGNNNKIEAEVLEDAVLLELFGKGEIMSLISNIMQFNNKLADWMGSGIEKMEQWKFTEENYDYEKCYVNPLYNSFQNSRGAAGFPQQKVTYKPIIPVPPPNVFYKAPNNNEGQNRFKELTANFADIAFDLSGAVVQASPNVIDDVLFAAMRYIKNLIEQKIAGQFGGIFKKLLGILEKAASFLQQIGSITLKLASETIALCNAFLCGMLNGLVSLLQTILSVLAFIVGNIPIFEIEHLSQEALARHQEKLEFVEDFIDLLFDNAVELFAGLMDFMVNLEIWKELQDFFKSIAKKFSTFNAYFWAFFVGGVLFEITLDAVIAYFTGGSSLVAQVSAKISRINAKAPNFGKNVGRKVADSTADLLKFLKKEFEELVEAIKSGEFIQWLKNKFSKLMGESVTTLSKYEVNILVRKATQNSNSKKVMLGKYIREPLEESYNYRAGKDHTFFEMKVELWEETFEKVNEDRNEMWKLNKQFLDEQFKQKKEFFLSHDPENQKGFYADEIDHLTITLKGEVVKIKEELWKIEF